MLINSDINNKENRDVVINKIKELVSSIKTKIKKDVEREENDKKNNLADEIQNLIQQADDIIKVNKQ